MQMSDKYVELENRIYESIVLEFSKRQIPQSIGYLIMKSVTGRIADEAIREGLLREQALESKLISEVKRNSPESPDSEKKEDNKDGKKH